MTLTEFGKTARRLQYLVFAFPIISKIFDHHAGVPFPPMGDQTQIWRFFAMAIIGVSAFLPYFLLPKCFVKWSISTVFILFILSSAIYLSLQDRYVVSLPSEDGKKAFVIRGSERNPELKEPYASMSDEELIEHSGMTDMDLKDAYKWVSIKTNRRKMFWSYVLSLSFLELTLGSFAKAGSQTVVVTK